MLFRSGTLAIRDHPGGNQVARGEHHAYPLPPPRMTRWTLPAVLALLMGGSAAAEPAHGVVLGPDTARIDFRAYAFGVLPIDGTFIRFDGRLTFAAAGCRLVLRVEVASLAIADPAMRADMLSANLLDATTYPALAFEGACQGEAIAGDLTLHGVTHPLVLSVTHDRGETIAEGTLLRTDWGITGRPLLAGRTVRLRLTVLPTPGTRPAGPR